MIVLDTHAWLWWQDGGAKLSAPARHAIAEASRIGVSTISVWEVATLVRRGRIALDRATAAWVRLALADPRVEPLAPTADVAIAAAELDDGFPGDPADRLIFACARAARVPLVTRDAQITSFAPGEVIW